MQICTLKAVCLLIYAFYVLFMTLLEGTNYDLIAHLVVLFKYGRWHIYDVGCRVYLVCYYTYYSYSCTSDSTISTILQLFIILVQRSVFEGGQ